MDTCIFSKYQVTPHAKDSQITLSILVLYKQLYHNDRKKQQLKLIPSLTAAVFFIVPSPSLSWLQRVGDLAETGHSERSSTSAWKWFSEVKGGRQDWRLLNVRYSEPRLFARTLETLRGLRSNACPIYSRQRVVRHWMHLLWAYLTNEAAAC